MKLLIDECLHTSLVGTAEMHGHEARHVNWLGLSGQTDWGLMQRIVAEDFAFVTNNARDFMKLFAREPLHAGLIIIVPQVVPSRQRELFDALLHELGPQQFLMNEVVEVAIDGDEVIISRYELPTTAADLR